MRRGITCLLLCLSVLLLPLSLAACKKPPDEGEVIAAAKALLPRAAVLNEVYIGEGIPTVGEAFEGYLFADGAWCLARGFSSLEELLALTAAVYTDEAAEPLLRKALTTNDETLADYRARHDGKGLYVLAARQGWYSDTENEYLTDTIKIVSVGRDTATVTLTVRVTKEGKPPKDRTLKLPLVRGEDGVWRADKITYVAYEED